MLWLIGLIVVLLYAIYWAAVKPYGYWKTRNVPFPKPTPVFGNFEILVFRRGTILDMLMDLYNKFPNERYIGIYAFRDPRLFVRDIELIKQITIKDFDSFINRTASISEDTDRILAKNLTALEGQKWRDMRATLSPSFTTNKMKFLYQLIYNCAEQFVDYYKKNEDEANDLEMKDVASRFANDVIATSAFGITTDSLHEKDNEFFINGKNATKFTGFRGFLMMLYQLAPFTRKILRISVFSQKVSEFFERIIRETIDVRQKNKIVRPDMIHLLLESQREREQHEQNQENINNGEESKITKRVNLSEEDIAAQGLLFFFAGFDTISTAISFLSYELAVNPLIQKRLQAEIDDVIKNSKGSVPYDVLIGAKYLDMVISEGLRKWTPGAAIDRVCVKDYVIDATSENEKSLLLEKGMSILIPVYAIHHDPQYFKDPETFDPERFNEENKSNIISGSYMPFGSGPRNCIASRFALMELKIIFFHVLANFDIVTTDKTPIPLILSKKTFTLAPDEGFCLGFKKRNNSL